MLWTGYVRLLPPTSTAARSSCLLLRDGTVTLASIITTIPCSNSPVTTVYCTQTSPCFSVLPAPDAMIPSMHWSPSCIISKFLSWNNTKDISVCTVIIFCFRKMQIVIVIPIFHKKIENKVSKWYHSLFF